MNWPNFALDKGCFKQISFIIVNMLYTSAYPSNLRVVGSVLSW